MAPMSTSDDPTTSPPPLGLAAVPAHAACPAPRDARQLSHHAQSSRRADTPNKRASPTSKPTSNATSKETAMLNEPSLSTALLLRPSC